MRLESTKHQPKILRKMVYRFSILAIVAAIVVAGFVKIRELGKDIDLPLAADTAGMIAATEFFDEGSQAVVFGPDGKKLASPGYKAGRTDKDPAWRPDGNRLFFVSDREEDALNVFRWNFGSGVVARRTLNSRSKGMTQWPSPLSEGANRSALITSGGFVLEFDPTEGTTRQILPPVQKNRASGEEGGAAGQFDAMYQRLGSSFKLAKWTFDKTFAIAVMRNDFGEILITQDLSTGQPPVPIAAGERIEFDVHPGQPLVYYAVLNYQLVNPDEAPPELVQPDGSVKLPFRHMMGIFDPTKTREAANAIVAFSATDESAFQSLSASPDGTTLMVVDGAYLGSGNFKPRGIVLMPAQEGGGGKGTLLVKGECYEPSWFPDSKGVVFIQYDEKKKRSIFKLNRDGSGLENVSRGAGNFAHPRMSPQTKD
jgi:hypothetical protein